MRGKHLKFSILAAMIAMPAFAQDAPEKVANAKPGAMRLFVSNGLRGPAMAPGLAANHMTH